jgi:hypothetical protein
VLGGFGQIEERWRGVFGGNNGGHVRWFLVPGIIVIGTKSITEKTLRFALEDASVSGRKNLAVKLLDALRYRFKNSPHDGL